MTDVIAHRGLHLTERENTLSAFAAAVAAQVSGIELDVRRTADGVLVVHHDAHLADGRAIVACARAELPAYVPELDDALDACGGVWVNIEIKNSPDEPDFDPSNEIADAVLDTLAGRSEHRSNWLISSFWRPLIDRIVERDGSPPTAWLTVHRPSDEELEEAVTQGHRAVHPWERVVDEDLVQISRSVGLRVNVWTVNDPARAVELSHFGVHGICTDDPERLERALVDDGLGDDEDDDLD